MLNKLLYLSFPICKTKEALGQLIPRHPRTAALSISTEVAGFVSSPAPENGGEG